MHSPRIHAPVSPARRTRILRKLGALATGLTLACLAACGGGGGGGSSSGTSASSSSASYAGTPTGTGAAASTAANVQPVVVAQGLSGTYNLLTTSVTLCVPGTTQCQTIDNVQVDTGSVGLRVLSSALGGLSLPAVAASGGGISGACGVFGSGVTWGAVRSADVKLSGEVAANIPLQVISDPATPDTPTDCANRGSPMQNTTQLKLNGILGVGLFVNDCGSACASTAIAAWYYACQTNGSCTNSTQPIASQIINPVAAFSSDNNGVVISLPTIPSAGSSSVSGTMTFGIGTQSDNGLSSATVLPTRSGSSYVTSVMNGATNSYTFLDSGSNGMFFSDSSLTQCGVWYCENASLPLTLESGTIQTAATLTIESESLLSQVLNFAFSNLAGPSSSDVDLGLPFFYGRNVYVAIEGRTTPGGAGPYYAF